jgi:hypothetical protein
VAVGAVVVVGDSVVAIEKFVAETGLVVVGETVVTVDEVVLEAAFIVLDFVVSKTRLRVMLRNVVLLVVQLYSPTDSFNGENHAFSSFAEDETGFSDAFKNGPYRTYSL